MFPLTSNEAYIKSTGERSTLGRMLEEGGNEPIERKLDAEIQTRAALGAHNLLPLTVEGVKAANAGRGVWDDNAITIRGITYTLYTDSEGNITYIDADGTATDGSNYSELWLIPNYSANKYKDKILNGTPTGYGNNCGINVSYFQGTTWKAEQLSYNGANSTLSLDWPNILFAVVVRKLTTVTHAKFYPMVRLADDPATDYTPYAMTNQELTDTVKPLVPAILPNNTDLNNITTEGTYILDYSNTYTNAPVSGVNIRLDVRYGNSEKDRVIQIAYALSTAPKIYMRRNGADSWFSWYEFAGTEVT